MGWFDDVLIRLAPRLAVSRLRHQATARTLASQLRRYEGAATSRRTAGWRGTSGSANSETGPAAAKLRANARDLERNNGWAAKAIAVIVANTVGTGIRLRPRHARSKRKVEVAGLAWAGWAETTACDYDGMLDFYGLQALALQTVVRDGEVLIVLRPTRAGATSIPLQLQVLEADHLDTARVTGDNGNRAIQGVEVDAGGRPVAYWLFPDHPADPNSVRLQSVRIPAADVIHVFRKERPGQLRAASWLAPVMMPLKDLDDFEDAQLMKQKAAACYAVFVTDATGSDDALTDTEAEDVPDRLEPGMIQVLPAGKDVKFADPPSLDGYTDYVRAVLRKVAAGLGLTFESLTGDLSQTNFSGGRMGWLEQHRNVEGWRWRMLIPQLCVPVWSRFVEAAIIAGHDLAGVTGEWTPPRRELISPKDDILAEQMAMRNGLKSWSESVREQGYDPDQVLEEIAAERARFDALGVVLDCDPSKTTAQGQAQKEDTDDDEGAAGAAVAK